jgi:hypothetical protein
MKAKKTTKEELLENKLFVPNFSKERFKIEIIVYENCQTMKVIHLQEGIQVTYQEVVGALSISHQGFIQEQTKSNAEEYEKLKNKNGSKLK